MVSIEITQRVSDLARNSVARSLALSLALHLVVFTVLELGFRAGLWQHSLLAQLLNLKRTPTAEAEAQRREQERKAQNAIQEVPVVFVPVDASQASEQAPEKTIFYGARNSIAANREATVERDVPKITGTQEKVPRATEIARAEPLPPATPLEPLVEPKPVPQPLQPAPEVTPAPAPERGETISEKPAEPNETKTVVFSEALKPEPRPAPPAPQRPRRLAQVRPQPDVVGEKMKQEGGVRRRASVEGLDVKATPFGSYDAAIIAAIQKAWYDLLDQRSYVGNDSGKVVITFRLNSDGTVTELQIQENEVSEILAIVCQRAISDPAPFARWPSDLRRLVGADYRLVRFTFHYN